MTALPHPTPLPAWLRHANQRWPQAAAVEQGDRVLSYAELHARVVEQARRIRAAGLRPGDRVAIAATRDMETIISILAAVEAGVAYVPLDLSYPADRLKAMLEAAAVRCVFGTSDALHALAGIIATPLPSLAAPREATAQPHAASADLTYVLFTSGSTGTPKGVAMGAMPLAHLIQYHCAHPRLGRAARTLQFAPLSFDVHFQEIFSTVACGGTLVLVPDAVRRDPAALFDAICSLKVERMFVPYVALQMIADAADDRPCALRDVISAGEQLQVTPSIRQFFARLPDAALHNHYGPTESHVVTALELTGAADAWPAIPSIGTPLPHVRLAIRDAELLLGGETLANGYLGQPERTRERFLEQVPGLPGRWYATGDLVELLPSGHYQYLGRADQQIKIDGFRVEPGEIEVALMKMPAVREAVVAAPELADAGRALVAYLVLHEGMAAPSVAQCRAFLRAGLPEYMLPSRLVVLDRLPMTPSGKIDRRALPVPAAHRKPAVQGTGKLEAIRALWCELLGTDQLQDDQNLFDAGAKSLLVLRFVKQIAEAGYPGIGVTDVYDRPTIRGIAEGAAKIGQRAAGRHNHGDDAIAIVGMASRTPGAPDVEAFWRNLLEGVEGITHFAPSELDPAISAELRSRSNYVPARGVLEDAGGFDSKFFGLGKREALFIDPQQRLLLELCWNALENAGIDVGREAGRIGVFAGTANNSYIGQLRHHQPELVGQYGEFQTMLASEKDYVATRIAHRLNLNGPAVSVHTACSTGLVAVAQACQSLATGQCEIALAGGATVIVPQQAGYLHVEGGMESADGHCRPFDADASGTVFSSGGGVVVLKRLADALASGDNIYAVIKGVGLNNDGADKASFTAPSVGGQAAAIRMALESAAVPARSIGFVEAHGTATSLGDPIEVAALTRAWRAETTDSGFCALGSLKGHLGHMIAAAGVMGLIKVALSLQREIIPRTLHFRRPNPQIDFANTPFTVVAQNQQWPRGATPRRAAVSSFGVGGTNAHLIVEEAPPVAASVPAAGVHVLPLSAKSPAATLARAKSLAAWLETHPAASLSEVTATLVRGRSAMPHRVSVAARTVDEARAALLQLRSATLAREAPRVVLLFPGQGSQHPGMARLLYNEVPVFRQALDDALTAIARHCDAPLRDWLVDAAPTDSTVADRLAETRYAQLALFSMSYAFGRWLFESGIQPSSMIGHSIGEYAAACLSGVFSLEDAAALVAERGRAMFDQPRGSMLAVRLGADEVRRTLPAELEIAGFNAASLTVVAGDAAQIERFAASLESQGIAATRLRVSHAFHSRSMEGAMPAVRRAAASIALKAPGTPVYSCVSGRPLQSAEAMSADYWSRQLREPVKFHDAVQAELQIDADTVFVEAGPGQALSALLRSARVASGRAPRVIPLMGPANDPGDPCLNAMRGLGMLWETGVNLQWPVSATARRASLPGYPFEHEDFWFVRREVSPPEPQLAAQPEAARVPMSRVPAIQQELLRIIADVSGLGSDEIDIDQPFLDQGLDSLSLTQATLEIERVFGVKLRFRKLLEDLADVRRLAAFLDAQAPTHLFAPVPAPDAGQLHSHVAALPALAGNFQAAGAAGQDGFVQALIQQQMQLMAQQLALLSGAMPPASASMNVIAAQKAPSLPASGEAPDIRSLVEKPFGASARINLTGGGDLSGDQRTWIADFIKRYNEKTARSKAFSQQHRRLMSDPRVVTGFDPQWKDLVYPIVADRSNGARLWDIDGNEYIDLLSCFGANLLGYRPPAVTQAMIEQLGKGIEVGPQHPLAAEVAALISEFTGMERVAFCNTGSEAVMGAMRIARTVTGRKTIAIFTNSYHGIFDEVIVRGTKQLRSLSAAPGILANAVENILVLDYASEDSLRVLRERGASLAAIMIEPIQNKYPTLQPVEFVRSLREIADGCGCALIFDEVVTGFRVAPGGAQEFYGVRADIATYGKVIGGGLPFAAIAGAGRWLDALDGGQWNYGDDSYPEAGVTYFAGTFVRHPLALAAAKATLEHLKHGGRALYERLNHNTSELVERLNSGFAARRAPVKAVHCASLWRLAWDEDQKFVSLFYYLLRFHGLHVYEQFGHFVTEAFADAELRRVSDLMLSCLDELMSLQFIRPRGGPAPIEPHESNLKRPLNGTLGPGQTERWLAAGFDAHAARALNESFCLSLSGDVDVDVLQRAAADVIGRHDAFRVRFSREDPQQSLDAAAVLPVQEIDLRKRPDADAALDEFCAAAAERTFDISRAPLAAASLLKLADGRVVFHMVASHLIFDGWAASVFVDELAIAYFARKAGRMPALPEPASPILFAEQERARFDGAEGQECLNYWKSALASAPPPLRLHDLREPSPREFRADTVRAAFDEDALAAMRRRARASGVTLFQYLLGAVTALLQSESNQDEFIVSVPYASQLLQPRGPLLADGVLDLPLRLTRKHTDGVDATLQHVRDRLMDALDHPLMTQGTVARALGIRSSGNRPPLTGIYFNLNPKIDLKGFAPLDATLHEGRKSGTLAELFFNFHEQPTGLTLDLHYSSDLFSAARAASLVECLCAICREWAAISVEAQPAPPPATALRGRELALDEKASVQAWISAQAARTPDRVAVSARGTDLTYRSLEEHSNRIANVLLARGIGVGSLVGICLGRGVDLVPAMLGVLKTGAGYVPLDPGFPADRLSYMASDAGLAAVITESAHADLAGLPRHMQLRMDEDQQILRDASTVQPVLSAPQTAPAYVIYTSGSTGKPKGVVVPQRAVCNFLRSMQSEPGLSPDDVLLAVTTLSFDIAVLELLLPLTVGAKVVLAQRDEAMDGVALSKLLEAHRVTAMQATPTTWQMLLEAGWKPASGLRALCGGEALPLTLARTLTSAGVELWNMYGPTETTVWSTIAKVVAPVERIHIGAPIDNTQVWILDDQQRPCPVGVEGEICIGGLGVANGYHMRPELTDERFIADRLSNVAGARLYRTGDLGRRTAAGVIEHLGRMDFQVKIRGYRIELGEIETVLTQQANIARAVAMARQDTEGDLRLVAYVVPQSATPLDLKALRAALRQHLPDYMLPQHLVQLETLPLLPNGKVDRKALPAPTADVATPTMQSSGEPAKAGTETEVAEAFAELLKMAHVGRDDDFFSLGGHSLLAARVIARINRKLGTTLALKELFEAPTVAKLARIIEARQSAPVQPARDPPVHVPGRKEAPLTVMQERIRFMEELLPGRAIYNAPSAHRLRGRLDVQALERAFQDMQRRQASLRTSIQRLPNGDWVQRVHDDVSCTILPVEDLSSIAPDTREEYLASRIDQLVVESFDLSRAPLFRVHLFRLGAEEHALFFMPHHIVWDGWSFDLFYAEIAELYSAHAAKRPPSLAPLAVTYGDFAEWHRRWMKSAEIQSQLRYWIDQYGNGLPPRAVSDLPRQHAATGRAGTAWLHFSTDFAEQVRGLAMQIGSTVSVVALTAYTAMMSQWLRDSQPFIGIPVRGRPSPELEPIMGFFNNMLPVRLAVSPSASCLDLLKSVRTAVIGAFANQDVPFEMVAREVESKQHNAGGALYQAMFSFQDARQRELQWGGLSHERIPAIHKGATEDINLFLVEIAGGMEGGVHYNADYFLPETAELLRDRFHEILQRLIENPQQSVEQLLRETQGGLRTRNSIAVGAEPAEWGVAAAAEGLRCKLNVLKSDVLAVLDSTELPFRQALEQLANSASASVKVVQAVPGDHVATFRRLMESGSVIHLPAELATRMTEGDVPVSAGRTWLLDVEAATAWMIDRLMSGGNALLSVWRPGSAGGLPVAAGWMASSRDAWTCGQPLFELSFHERGSEVPFGMAGQLRLPVGEGLSPDSSHEIARWRADGVVQYIGGSSRVSEHPRALRLSEDTPATRMEIELAAVWAELLKIESPSRADNFFELGGTSLLAMQAVTAMEVRTGKRVPPQRYPFDTLAQLAAAYSSEKVTPAPDARLGSRAQPRGVIARWLGQLRRAN